MNFPLSVWADSLPWVAVALVAVLAGTFVSSRVAGKHTVIDVAWGLLFCAVAIGAFAATGGYGDATRRVLLLVLPLVWGLRLAGHIGRRTRGASEDPRYEKMLARARGNRELYALRMIYLLQGVLALLVAAPITVGVLTSGPVGLLGWVGVALWALGLFFEAVGDAQLARFRTDPHRGTIMDRGLWRYTRHPNYFGDACVWWGIFLVAAERWPGVLTLFSPILMTVLLTRGSGVRILEAHMAGRPGWADYVRRTSAFLPLPPRRPAPRPS